MVNAIGGASMMPNLARIQRPEPLKAAETLVANLDTEGKGYLDVADLQAAFAQTAPNSTTTVPDAEEVFSAFDGNQDGQATAEEIAGALQNLADGAQYAQGMDVGAGRGMGGPGGPGGGPPPPPPPAEATDTTTAATLLDPSDTNGDGVVSAAESLAVILTSQTESTTTATAATTTADETTTATASTTSTTGSSKSTGDALQQRIMQLMDAYGLAQPAQQQSRAGISSTYQTGLSVTA